MDSPKIEIVWNSVVDEVLGDDDNGVTGVRLKNTVEEGTLEDPRPRQIPGLIKRTLVLRNGDGAELVPTQAPVEGNAGDIDIEGDLDAVDEPETDINFDGIVDDYEPYTLGESFETEIPGYGTELQDHHAFQAAVVDGLARE